MTDILPKTGMLSPQRIERKKQLPDSIFFPFIPTISTLKMKTFVVHISMNEEVESVLSINWVKDLTKVDLLACELPALPLTHPRNSCCVASESTLICPGGLRTLVFRIGLITFEWLRFWASSL